MSTLEDNALSALVRATCSVCIAAVFASVVAISVFSLVAVAELTVAYAVTVSVIRALLFPISTST